MYSFKPAYNHCELYVCPILIESAIFRCQINFLEQNFVLLLELSLLRTNVMSLIVCSQEMRLTLSCFHLIDPNLFFILSLCKYCNECV